jgi:amino acid adenylation domain-containing protein
VDVLLNALLTCLPFESKEQREKHIYILAMAPSVPLTLPQQDITQFEEMIGSEQDPKLATKLDNNAATSLKLHQSPMLAPSTKLVDFELTSKQNRSNERTATEYWRSQFVEAEAAHFPHVPLLQNSRQICRRVIEQWVTGFHRPFEDISMTTRIWAAWAILIAAHTNSTDVVFGADILNNSTYGRHEASIDLNRGTAVGAKSLVAPVRVVILQEERVEQILARLQQQIIDIVQHGGLGLQKIRLLSEAANECCMFQTLLRVRTNDTNDDAVDHMSGFANEFCSTQITCTLEEHGMKIRLDLGPATLSEARGKRIVQQLEHLLRQLCAPEAATRLVQDMTMAGEVDLRDILTWNAGVFASTHGFVDDLISQTMKRQPSAQAVNAWDGELNYGELDSMSTQLARHLIGLGIGPEVVVPLCFEKSVWTPVAMLAVMKARGASVALDVSQPEDRLRVIVEKVRPSVILSSTSTMNLAAGLYAGAAVIAVDRDFLESFQPLQRGQSLQHHLPSDPGNLLYLVCTSGSTGIPKAVAITHANMRSAFTHQSKVIGFTTRSRVLDLSSYAFDVAWYNVLHTFHTGAVLCIPRQGDDVSKAIISLKPNFLDCTPTVASLLNDEAMRCLDTVELLGEVAHPDLITKVRDGRTCRNVYGPSECTTFACVSEDFRHPTHIGYGFGARTWIVDPSGHHLAPVGTVGELWLEGPIVGRGYYNDEERTQQVFVDNPSWMIPEGSEDVCRRVYRTGDLVRYEDDGTLAFMGRKDSQVKINGQRLELGEVEYHLRQLLDEVSLLAQVVVETVQPKKGERLILVAFLAPTGWMKEVLNAAMPELTRGLSERLAKKVPSFMIPTMYIPVASVPMTATGKTDRKRLRELGVSFMAEKARQPHAPEKRPPRTPDEKRLSHLWATVLGIDEEKISADDSFLRLGGDSLYAMRLLGAAHEQGLSFSMTDIFRHPVLNELAVRMVAIDEKSDEASVPPFSMLPGDNPIDFVEQHVLPQLPNDRGIIEDVYHVSHIQKLLLSEPTTSAIRPPHFFIMDFAASLDIPRLEETLTALVSNLDILRAVFVQVQGVFYQVVLETLRVPIELQEVAQDIETATNQVWKDDHYNNPLQLGRPLLRFTILRSKDIVRLFVKFSHAQWDAIGLTHLAPAFGALYRGETLPTVPPFSRYIHHATHKNRKVAYSYWKSVLRGSTMTSVDSPSKSVQEKARDPIISGKKILHMPSVVNSTDFTPATIFTAACALMLSKVTGSRDVVFGKVVSGRHSLPSDCQTLVGPCVNVIPVRFQLGEDWDPARLLQRAHDQYLDSMPYEAVGIDQIIANCTDWPETIHDFWCVAGYRNLEPPLDADIGGLRVAWKDYERPVPISQVPAYAVEVTGIADGSHLHITLDASSQACNEEMVKMMVDELCAAVINFSRGVLQSENPI